MFHHGPPRDALDLSRERLNDDLMEDLSWAGGPRPVPPRPAQVRPRVRDDDHGTAAARGVLIGLAIGAVVWAIILLAVIR